MVIINDLSVIQFWKKQTVITNKTEISYILCEIVHRLLVIKYIFAPYDFQHKSTAPKLPIFKCTILTWHLIW